MPIGELPGLIQTVHATLTGLTQPAPEPEVELQPAVNPKKSVSDDHIICLDRGKAQKMLKRHLLTAHSVTPEQYRARWSLPHDCPMVAPNYAKTREELATKIGLGRTKAACAWLRSPSSSPARYLATQAREEG